MTIPLDPSGAFLGDLSSNSVKGSARSTGKIAKPSSSNKRLLKEPIKPQNAARARAVGGWNKEHHDIRTPTLVISWCNWLARDGESSHACPDSMMPKICQTATKKHGKHHAWEAIGNNTYAGQDHSGPIGSNNPNGLNKQLWVLKTRLSSACRRNRALQYLKFSKFRSLRGVGNDQLRLVVIKYHERRTGSSFSMIQHVGSTLGLALSMTYSIGMTHLHPRYAWWDRGSEAQSHHHCGSLTLAAMALTSLTRCFTNIRHGINIVTLKVSNCTNNSNVNRC